MKVSYATNEVRKCCTSKTDMTFVKALLFQVEDIFKSLVEFFALLCKQFCELNTLQFIFFFLSKLIDLLLFIVSKEILTQSRAVIALMK